MTEEVHVRELLLVLFRGRQGKCMELDICGGKAFERRIFDGGFLVLAARIEVSYLDAAMC